MWFPIFRPTLSATNPGRSDSTRIVDIPLGVRIGHAEEGDVVADRSVRDERLGAVDHVLVPLAPGGGIQAEDVRAVVRLRERPRGETLAGDDARDPLLLQLLRAVPEEHVAPEGGHLEADPDPRVFPAELLGDQDVLQRPVPLAAQLLRVVESGEAELGPLADDLAGIRLGALQLHGQVPVELALGELTGCLLDVLLLSRQREIHLFSPRILYFRSRAAWVTAGTMLSRSPTIP
jgi:hypothetical protein